MGRDNTAGAERVDLLDHLGQTGRDTAAARGKGMLGAEGWNTAPVLLAGLFAPVSVFVKEPVRPPSEAGSVRSF